MPPRPNARPPRDPDAGASSPPAFRHAFWLTLPHGILSAVTLPERPDAIPESIYHQLFREEAEHAWTLRGWRRSSWVGGRLAAHHATERLGARQTPLLPLPDGGIAHPEGLGVSISHTRSCAVALVAYCKTATLGVDMETLGVPRLHLAPRILHPEELEAVVGLREERRWLAVLLRFCIKEALYKALRPHVPRFIGFQEASIQLKLNGLALVDLHLEPPGPPLAVEARYHWLTRSVLATVKVAPAAP